LTLETCRVIHIQIENKNLSQVASVGLLIGIYGQKFAHVESRERFFLYMKKLKTIINWNDRSTVSI
jgi:hypothetical protein